MGQNEVPQIPMMENMQDLYPEFFRWYRSITPNDPGIRSQDIRYDRAGHFW